jgi:AI-2 transport protein TqsA
MERRIQTICLMVLTGIAIAFALFWLRPVMIPFVLALFASLGLSTMTDFQVERLRVPRRLALPGTLLLGAVVFSLLSALVSASVGQLIANSAIYNQQLAQTLEELIQKIPPQLTDLAANVEIEKLIMVPIGAVKTMLTNTSSALLDIISQSLLVLIFMIFLMIGSGTREPSTGTWGEIEQRIKRYLVVKAVISALTGLLVGSVLAILDVPLAMVFGLFAFLLNFIPSIGSILSTLLPVPVVLVSPDVTGLTAALAIGLPALIQMVVGNFMEPKIMGESLDLHPVAILLMLIFWGMLWGVVGMLLATPITAVLKILFEKLETTRPLADLLAGRVGHLRTPGPEHVRP